MYIQQSQSNSTPSPKPKLWTVTSKIAREDEEEVLNTSQIGDGLRSVINKLSEKLRGLLV